MLSLAIALATTVTVTFTSTPLPKALEQLSAATGERLTCARALENEQMVARLKEADPARVLREVAQCFDAQWETGTNGRILIPDVAAKRKREAAEQQLFRKEIAESMAELSGRLSSQPRNLGRADVNAYLKKQDAEEKRRAEAERRGKVYEGDPVDTDSNLLPAWRALARLTFSLGPQFLTNMRERERLVWSERPTAMQLPFPAGMQGTLANYRREMALFAPPARLATRIRLSVQRWEHSFGIRLTVLDASGKISDRAQESLEGGAGADRDVPSDPHPAPSSAPEKPLQIPDEAREYFSILSSRQSPVRDATFERWLPRLLDPVAFEPTRYAGMLLLATAEGQNRNLLGSVPEYNIVRSSPQDLSKLTPSAFLKQIGDTVTLQDGWLIVKSDWSPPRLSRAEAKTFYASSATRQGLSVDDAAAWVIAHPAAESAITWFGDRLAMKLTDRGAYSARALFLDDESLNFWSQLGDNARHELRRGSSLLLESLPPAIRTTVYQDVFWNHELDFDGFDPEALDGFDPEGLEGEEVPTKDDEITDRLPAGLAGATISLEITSSPVVIAWNKANGEPIHRSFLTAANLGRAEAMGERKGTSVDYDQFRFGTMRRFELKIEFKKQRLSYSKFATEAFLDSSAPLANQLPADFRRLADEEKKKLLALPDPFIPHDPVKP